MVLSGKHGEVLRFICSKIKLRMGLMIVVVIIF